MFFEWDETKPNDWAEKGKSPKSLKIRQPRVLDTLLFCLHSQYL